MISKLPAPLQRFAVPIGVLVAAGLLLGVVPAILEPFRLNFFGQYLCFGIVAIGIGLAWGRGGMLTLGQGVFFGLGAYIMAMHMKLEDAKGTSLGIPDFMALYGTDPQLPTWWKPFQSSIVTLVAIPVIPMILAAGLGFMVFRRKVRGAYFAILSQALAGAFALWIVGNQTTTAGQNGMTNMRSFFGYDMNDPVNQRMVYSIIVVVMLALLLLTYQLMRSRFGELLVATRDAEERVRFLGYEPANVKLVAFVLSAGMAGIGGALYVPLSLLIAPSLIGIVPSIGFVIGVAIGGRNTWLGPVIGGTGIAWAQQTLSEKYPAQWQYLQGALFVVVIAVLPLGVASLGPTLRARFGKQPPSEDLEPSDAEITLPKATTAEVSA
ncbi:MAG: urea ABC transporter permease subunit UrtC [Kineosporiaceae bacterium]